MFKERLKLLILLSNSDNSKKELMQLDETNEKNDGFVTQESYAQTICL